MMNESTLVVEGWKLGFNKVAFTKLLQAELSLSLSSAKAITDQILEGEQVTIAVPIEKLDNINAVAEGLGAKVIPISTLVEDSCR